MRVFGLSLAALALSALALRAEPVRDSAEFDLVMMGLTVGAVRFTGSQDGQSYAVTGKLETTGLVAFLKQVSYDAESAGTVAGRKFVPQRYREKADTGERQSEAVMEYIAGVPQVKAYNPPRPPRKTDVDPASQGGTLDPLSALYAALRDAAPGQECNLTVPMFDGRRASRLTLSAPQPADDGGVTCSGEYRRVAGFTRKDMKKKTVFPFTLRYAPVDGRMRVVEVTMDTLYGQARMVRQ